MKIVYNLCEKHVYPVAIKKRTGTLWIQDTSMRKEPHVDLGYVVASRYRRAIMSALENGALCPTELSVRTKYPQSHVSNTLSTLVKRGLVVCVNPSDRKGRLYRLTSDGEEVCTQLACHPDI